MTEPLAIPIRYWQAGGPVLSLIALVCALLWTYFFRTRSALLAAADELDRLESAAHGFLPSPAHAARHDFRSDLDRRGSDLLARLGRDLSVIAALAGAAPLLGLLGTVTGMIATFQAVSTGAGQISHQVAAGISEALITTQFGLVVAIPGVFGVARLRRLLHRVRDSFARYRSHALLQAVRTSAAGPFPDAQEAAP